MIHDGRRTGSTGLLRPGVHPGVLGGGSLPGVLGFGSLILVADSVVGSLATRLPMPRPFGSLSENATDFDNKGVHVVKGPLFPKDKDGPFVGDVKQGIISNCALASILAAHAHTVIGRKHLRGMIKEISGKGVLVESSVGASGPLVNPPAGSVVVSNRYFTVTVGGKSVEVSDVFYSDNGERDSWTLLYMRSEAGVLWPSVIEKAVAVFQGGYHKLDVGTLTANDMWALVTGKQPRVTEVKKMKDADILKAARDATGKPTIAGSVEFPKNVAGNHGFAVLGVAGGRVEVHDPARVEKSSHTVEAFRQQFFFVMSQ